MSDNLYEVLGVAPNASVDVIRTAYRRLAREAHPDAAGATTAAQVRMSELNEAWRVLGDQNLKRAYDHHHGFVVDLARDGASPTASTRAEPQSSSRVSAMIAVASAFGSILMAFGFVGSAPAMIGIGLFLMSAAALLWLFRRVGLTRPDE